MNRMSNAGIKILSLLKQENMTLGGLAKCLGITRQSLYNKMYGMQDFTREEMLKIKQLFNLSAYQMDDIFFEEAV